MDQTRKNEKLIQSKLEQLVREKQRNLDVLKCKIQSQENELYNQMEKELEQLRNVFNVNTKKLEVLHNQQFIAKMKELK